MSFIPAQHILSSTGIGCSNATPTDARSMYYDAAVSEYRDYQSTAEVLAYLDLARYRTGHFPIYVHSGGSLSAGVWTGGITLEYWFKDGVADGDLVLKVDYGYEPFRWALGVGEDVTVGTDKTAHHIASCAGTLVIARIHAGTAPVGAALIVDINADTGGGFATIWSTQANRIQLASGSANASQSSFNTVNIPAGTVFSIDVDQAGSTTAGQKVTVLLLKKNT